ncbi:MAG: HEAT repeat domain-containing protein [Bacteroidales bacterium]|nr:HEAT repeat domain-containing protein [Bacteroidales bacterium]
MMNCEEIKLLFVDYLDNTLNETDKAIVEKHIEKCKSCQKEIKDLQHIFPKTDDKSIEVPSDEIRKIFYEMLENEKQIQAQLPNIKTENKKTIRFINSLAFRIAASFIILIVGYGIGFYVHPKTIDTEAIDELTNHVSEMKQFVMMNEFQKSSASERAHFVKGIEDIPDPDINVLRNLIHLMNTDENDNVRLAAISALSRFGHISEVRDELLSALKNQKEPMIQIKLIDVMVNLEEKRALKPFRQIINNEENSKLVKNYAVKGYEYLSI